MVAPGRGYVWTATARVLGVPVTGYDRYGGGTAEMRWRVFGAVPVVSADGPDVAFGAAGRLAWEMALLPTAFQRAVCRDGPDPDTTIATWEIDGGVPEVRLRVGQQGQLLDVLIQRGGQPPVAELGWYPFGVTVLSEQTWAGVTLPARFRAGWWWGTPREDEGAFLRGHLTGASLRMSRWLRRGTVTRGGT